MQSFVHSSLLEFICIVQRLFLLCLIAVPAFAAAPEIPAPLPVTGANTVPVDVSAAIAVPDIVARVEKDQQLIDQARQMLTVPDPARSLRLMLDDIERTVGEKLQVTGSVDIRRLPAMRLESLTRYWELDARRLEQWEADNRKTFKPLADAALDLAQRRTAWARTRAEGKLEGLPAAIIIRVDAVFRQIDALETALGHALDQQFMLARRAAYYKQQVETKRQEIDIAIQNVDRRLFTIEAAPLWEGVRPNAGIPEIFGSAAYGLHIERRFAIDYQAVRTQNQQALWLMQTLLAMLVLWLYVRGKDMARQGQSTRHADPVMRRPLSAWLLLSMLAVLTIEPDAPLLGRETALLLTIIPVVRLLPAGAFHALGFLPYLAITLYVGDRLCVIAASDNGWYRILLLVLNIMALVLTGFILRTSARASSTANRDAPPRMASLVGRAVLILLLIAIAANVVGNVSLAEMLTSGIIDSSYFALLAYSGVNASLTIVSALLAHPKIEGRHLIRQHGATIRQAVRRLLILVAVLGWFVYSADRFRLLRPLVDAARAIAAWGIEVGEVSIDLGDVLVFALSTWLAVRVALIVRRLLRDELPTYAGLPRGVGNSIASLTYYAVLLLGLLLALSAAGFKVGQLALVFGALGVGIGFGLQNVVNNFVSGLVLMFERPIQPGDIVDAAGSSGTVQEIRLRSTTIRSFDGADIVLPNGLLLSGNMTNWTMHDQFRRFSVSVGVDYDADQDEVRTLLNAVARETPGVIDQPAPVVLLSELGQSAVVFEIRVWTRDASAWLDIRSNLLSRALARLREHGIGIPYRQIDVHLHVSVGATGIGKS